LAGKLSDKYGKYKIFVYGSLLTAVVVAYYCNLGITPLAIVIALNIVMFAGVTSRMISASALMTAIPEPQDRGAYMSIQSSVQQISGGLASVLAGTIVVQSANGVLQNYDLLGYIVVFATMITIGMMYIINQAIKEKSEVVVETKPLIHAEQPA